MNNENGTQKSMLVYAAAISIILLLLISTIYFYNQYQKVKENNMNLKVGLENTVLSHLSSGKYSIESVINIVESQGTLENNRELAIAYSSFIAVTNSVDHLIHTLDKKPQEIKVLMSMKTTLTSLNSFLIQIFDYYGYRNQQPFELKNCASGRMEDEEDIYNELVKFLDIIDYAEESKKEWYDLIAGWEVDNPYSCTY